MSSKGDKHDDLFANLMSWEGYDPQLSPLENYIELQLQMGFLTEVKHILHNIAQK
jgi:hypothetical protein